MAYKVVSLCTVDGWLVPVRFIEAMRSSDHDESALLVSKLSDNRKIDIRTCSGMEYVVEAESMREVYEANEERELTNEEILVCIADTWIDAMSSR